MYNSDIDLNLQYPPGRGWRDCQIQMTYLPDKNSVPLKTFWFEYVCNEKPLQVIQTPAFLWVSAMRQKQLTFRF